MAIKKVKRAFGGGGAFSGGARAGERSLRRPQHVEKMPPCHNACPSGNRIRGFLTTIAQAERLGKSTDQALEEAWYIYTDTSPFPAVCGRVCPHPCEDNCNRRELDGAVNINPVERAIGAYGLANALKLKKLTAEKRPERIAVVGAGPAGLSCAYQLARRGYSVTVFEVADKPGGMLLQDIPRFRLPAGIVEGEIQKILDLGVELKCGTWIGRDISLDDLRSRYNAVFVAIGAEKDLKLGVQCELVNAAIIQAPDFAGLESLVESPDTTAVAGTGQSVHDDDAASQPLVTTAIGRGRHAAKLIDRTLRRIEPEKEAILLPIGADRMRLDHYEKKARATFDASEELTTEQAAEEATRCMSCGYCFDCEKCWLYCQEQGIVKPARKGMLYTFDYQKCTGCRKCVRECPCGFIDTP